MREREKESGEKEIERNKSSPEKRILKKNTPNI